MERPIVVNLRSYRGNDVTRVCRPTKWGNPFIIGRDGQRKEVIEKYRQWILGQPTLLAALPELAGKKLACWCTPLACHADVLADLVEKLPGGGLNA